MKSSFALRATLAVAATLFAAACEQSPSAPAAAADGEVAFTTGAPFPAVPGFTARSSPQPYATPAALLAWQTVEGADAYLIQWRVGEAGTWRTLVTAGRDSTAFKADSVRPGQRNDYRIAAMTADYRVGPFTTFTLTPGVVTQQSMLVSSTLARLSMGYGNYGPPGTYHIEYGTDPALAGATTTSPLATSEPWGSLGFDIPLAADTRYYWRAVGTNDGGTAYGEILTFYNGPPAAPTGITATFHELRSQYPNGGSTIPGYRVQVGWTHPGADVFRYRIQRRLAGQTAWTQAGMIGVPSTGLVDFSVPVTPGATYEYRVLACNRVDQCAASAPVQVTTMGMPAPANFTAMQRSSDGLVILQWQDLAAEEWYIIQWRADSTAGWNTILTSSPGYSFSGTGTKSVAAGRTNYYRMAGVGSDWRVGPWSNVSLEATQGLRIAVQTGTGSMTSANSAAVNGTVYPNGLPATAWFEWSADPTLAGADSTPAQGMGSGSNAVAASASITVPSAGTYYYRVVAANADTTVRGAIRSVFVAGPPAAPALTAAFSDNGFVVNLAWTHSGGGNPSYFRVYRRLEGGSTWALLKHLAASDPRSHVDIQFVVTAPRTYDYYVAACNVANECAPSSQQRVTTVPMDAPTGVTATRLQDGRVQVQWQDAAGTQDYLVQWRTESTGWTSLVSTGANATSVIVTQVTPGTTNYYRIAGLGIGNRTSAFAETSLVVP